MSISLANLSKLASLGLSTEQMEGVVEVLAEELAPTEERRRKDRERKILASIHGKSAEHETGKFHGNSAEDASRVKDNNLLSKQVQTVSKEDSPSFPHRSSKALSSPDPEGFAELWAAYPKRDGSADRKGAVKAYLPALRRASRETILEGAQHFARAMAERGKVGTELVPMLRTWLNGDRWNERYTAPPSKPTNTIAGGFALINGAIDERIRQLETSQSGDSADSEDAVRLPRIRQVAS